MTAGSGSAVKYRVTVCAQHNIVASRFKEPFLSDEEQELRWGGAELTNRCAVCAGNITGDSLRPALHGIAWQVNTP